jgi:hypothetical protein
VSAAGARPGLQNRGSTPEKVLPDKDLGKSTSPLSAQGQRTGQFPPDLVEVSDAWNDLPESVRQTVLILVRAARKEVKE